MGRIDDYHGDAVMDLDELERLARESTPGPWAYLDNGIVCYAGLAEEHPGIVADTDDTACGDYIAAASPDVLLALIARVRAAEAERDEARATVAALAKLGQYLKREYGQ